VSTPPRVEKFPGRSAIVQGDREFSYQSLNQAANRLAHAILFFFSFFLGTSLLFVLAPFVGALGRFPVLQIVGKMAAGLMGLYYLYEGVILIIGGLKIS